MKDLWQFYTVKEWQDSFLIGSISIFIMVSILFYFMLMISRQAKIRKVKSMIRFNDVIEKITFLMIFEDASTKEILQDPLYIKLSTSRFFREVLLSSIINLHKNYDGLHKKRIEQFYIESGLIKDSFAKLRSKNWEIVSAAINEVAEMNVKHAFRSFITLSKTNNKTLKIVAITACIKLAGAKGILHLINHKQMVDDWTQLNIVHEFKKKNLVDTLDIELLLESENPSVISLGLKIIKELNLGQKILFVEQLVTKNVADDLTREAQHVLQSLT